MSIVDSCKDNAVLTFTPTPFPATDPYVQYVDQSASEISWSDPGDVSIAGASVDCGSYTYSVLNSDNSPINSSIFTEDYATATKKLRV